MSSNPQSDFIRAGRGDVTRWASMYLISRQLDSHSHAEWHTCLRLPPSILGRDTSEGAQRHPRGAPLSAHVCPLFPFPDPSHRRMAPTVSLSGSLCLASPSRYAPHFPIPLLSHRHLMRPPPLLRLHHRQRRYILSLRRRQSSTSAVYPLG